jgi:hypothetical protein
MKKVFLLLLAFHFFLSLFSQEKASPSHDLYDSWISFRRPIISDNGFFFCYEAVPGKGDGNLILVSASDFRSDTISRGIKAAFAQGSPLFACKLMSPYEQTRKAKKDKVKEENMPKDSLLIMNLTNKKAWKYARVKDYQFPKENAQFVAIYFEKDTAKEKKAAPPPEKTDTARVDSIKTLPVKAEKKKSKKKKEGSDFMLLFPFSADSIYLKDVTGYALSKNGTAGGVIIQYGDSLDSAKVVIIDAVKRTEKTVYQQQGFAKNLFISADGKQYGFLYSADTVKEKTWSLFYAPDIRTNPACIADTQSVSLPLAWSPSEHFTPYFSDDGLRIVFGSAPRPVIQPKDTIPDDEKVKLDIWTYNDPRMQSQQLKSLDKDKKRTYLTLYHPGNEALVLLGDTLTEQVVMQPRALGSWSLGMATLPYEQERSWDFPGYRDFYLINNLTGKKHLIARKTQDNYSLSPGGNYYLWYSQKDSAWYTADTRTHKPNCLTCTLPYAFYDEENDAPKSPDAYGTAGWTTDDRFVLIYDRFDIWKTDPRGKLKPENLTGGRQAKDRFRYIQTDEDAIFIPENDALLKVHNDSNCMEGFFRLDVKKKQLKKYVYTASEVQFHKKAKNNGALLWSSEDFRRFPEICFSEAGFQNTVETTNGARQMENLYWGEIRPVTWTTFSGKTAKGLLITPDNMNEKQKYPMIVYFYEKNSQNLHTYYGIRPSRSVINFPMYSGNGYVIFIPDIEYGTGNPGEDAYDYIISGTEAMTKSYPWINSSKMGLQGQSWGGYQVAYLVTRTGKMFAAAMAGAAVSNMTSAYGGVRWESGQSRMFQYEKGQSRIGYSLWDSLDLYIKNSPLFGADKIETPLLMMNNDNDGAVPWYQGIELYSAMRRFQKPCWMLVYNNEEHNLAKRPNTIDLSIRMMQFFDHYLKDAPMPPWMKDGLPAINKGMTLGY